MAKDGTNRGGARAGAGAKRKPLADKIAEGNPGRRKLTVIDFQDTADLEGQPMPKPSAMLSATQKDGKTLVAAEIYEKTWTWLAERGCTALVSPQLLERYAMSVARWIQCEEAITEPSAEVLTPIWRARKSGWAAAQRTTSRQRPGGSCVRAARPVITHFISAHPRTIGTTPISGQIP